MMHVISIRSRGSRFL